VSHDFDLEPEFLTLYEACREQTLTSIERMYALYKAVEYVIQTGIPGDFAECGVWRGGSVMMMALAAQRFGDVSRTLWLYDTFSGMTAPTSEDVQTMTGVAAVDVLAASPKTRDDPFWGVAPHDVVARNLAATGYPSSAIRYVVGDVMDTLPAVQPDQLALLRLDTDWHESTRHELTHLYPRLSQGGVIIIDDYGYWSGARKAVDDFFDAEPKRPLLSRIDFTGRIGVRP
jgi:O-methyltransferase